VLSLAGLLRSQRAYRAGARRERLAPSRAAGSILRKGARGRLPTPAVIDVAIATLAVLLIASPLLLTSDGFAPDFTNNMWLAGYQEHTIAAHLHPTLFVQTQQSGVFYPIFAFYGGTLFALTGALGVVLGGSTILAYEVVTLAAIAAAYGGLFWLARQLGVRGALAHAPAIVFVTSAYYVTNLYGRGAWVEFMAVSALPLLCAASLRLVRGRWRAGPVACLVAASVVSSGFSITLLWGSTLAVVALACYWVLSGRSRELPWRRMLAVAGLIALGVGLNGWFLLPAITYAHDTNISGSITPWSYTEFFNTIGVVFDPLRAVPRESTTPALYVQAPVLALVWGLLALPLAWRERRLRAGAATALILLGGLLVLIISSAAYELLPSIFQQIQFAYRLQTFVTLACAGLVLVGVLALARRAQSGRATRSDRLLALGLGLAVAFGVGLSAWQLWVPNTHKYSESYSNRADALRDTVPCRPPGPCSGAGAGWTVLPHSWNAGNDFDDRSPPVIATTAEFTFDPAQVKDDRLVAFASLPSGLQPFATNIAGGPNLVHVGGGVRVIGRTSSQNRCPGGCTEGGNLVLQRTTDGSEPVPVELSARLSAPVLLGTITTGAAAAVLLALVLTAAVRRRDGAQPHRARRRRS
jgi:hypothetical protein